MATKTLDGKWRVDLRPLGRSGPRFRKTLPTREKATAYERHIQSKYGTQEDWEKSQQQKEQAKDRRKLSDIVTLWHTLHGHTLTSGDKRLQQLLATAKDLDDPIALQADPAVFLSYRKTRLSAGVTANHLNHELSYLKSAFNLLISLDKWEGVNPYGKIKKLPLQQKPPNFLNLAEVETLLAALDEARNPDVKAIVNICLSTGFRWSEAQDLRGEQIHNGKIHLDQTKTNRSRSVPITDSLETELFKGREKRGRLFKDSWRAFNFAIDRAGIELPKGQATHVLRHTFASHYVMAGGDLLALRDTLGHQTIQMTMAYAHLAPDHLAAAKTLNPLAQLSKCGHNVDATENLSAGTKSAGNLAVT